SRSSKRSADAGIESIEIINRIVSIPNFILYTSLNQIVQTYNIFNKYKNMWFNFNGHQHLFNFTPYNH
ncbi:MAG: hypothetical protein K8R01_01775, partial [Methanococcoides sp.]|nr:hypothetical protein [Methanococcoides sp.]